MKLDKMKHDLIEGESASIRGKIERRQRFYMGCAILITLLVVIYVTLKVMPHLKAPVEVMGESVDPQEVTQLRDIARGFIPELYDPLGFNPASDWEAFLTTSRPVNRILYFKENGEHVIEFTRIRGYGFRCNPTSRLYFTMDENKKIQLKL